MIMLNVKCRSGILVHSTYIIIRQVIRFDKKRVSGNTGFPIIRTNNYRK